MSFPLPILRRLASPLLLLACLLLPLAAADAPAAPAPAVVDAPTAAGDSGTVRTTAPKAGMIQRFQQGGITMWVLLGLSVAALTVALERLVNFRRGQVVPEGLAAEAQQRWSEQDFAALEALPEQRPSVLSEAIAVVTRHRHLDANAVALMAGDEVSRIMRGHLQRNYPLAVVATLAPLLGLFGTVTGMIDSFEVVAIAGSLGDASLLAGGISKALVTTAFGLAVSIPALGMYHYCRQRTNKLALEVEERINHLLSLWFHQPAPMPHVEPALATTATSATSAGPA